MPSAPFQLALRVVQALQRSGHIAYFAGGCVRDQLMGREPDDYDVATSALPAQVLALFPRSYKVGVAFGVVHVREKNLGVEVATFRSDGDYRDGRHPQAVTFSSPQADAQRRDFTCNGLFFDPVKNDLHDFVSGRNDLENRLLRAIGDPRQRFAEDHLRMLRAVRFAAKLGFEVEAQTHLAIVELQDEIQKISRERIGDEIRRIIEHPSRRRGIELLCAYPRMFSNIFHVAPERVVRPMEWTRLLRLAEPVPRPLGVAALLLDIWGPTGKELSTVTQKLRASLVLSNEETEAFAWWAHYLPLVDNWRALPVARFKRMMANPFWPDLARLYKAGPIDESIRAAFDARTAALAAQGVAPKPLISGDDLLRLGAIPGRQFKDWLHHLYDRQLEGELTARDQALAVASALVSRGSSSPPASPQELQSPPLGSNGRIA